MERSVAGFVQRISDRFRRYGERALQSYEQLRRARPSVDHAARAVERYSECNGSQLAGAITYFAFLSLFPLIALVFAVAGYAAAIAPEARLALEQAIEEALPGFAADNLVDEVAQARVGTGLIGLLILLYSGLGAIYALRMSLRTVWLKDPEDAPNFVVAKLTDLFVLVVLGLSLLASVALTSFAQAATGQILVWAGLAGTAPQTLTLRLLGLIITIAFTTLIFLVIFSRLSGTRRPWRMLWRGALLAAVGFEVLKSLGALLVAGTMDNPVYASFAATIGVLVWINIVARYLMFTAAWTATWVPRPAPRPVVVDHSGSAAAGEADAEVAGQGDAVSPPSRRGWPRRVGAGLVGAAAIAFAVWTRRRRRARQLSE